jgi:hypothetical protein
MATTPAPLASVGWRPPQWSKPAMVVITVPAGYSAPSSDNLALTNDANGVSTPTLTAKQTAPTSYVFDAVLSAEHDQALTKTHHPVQTGAAVSSHAYIEPAQLVLYVLMSDVAAQFSASNQPATPYIQQWTGNPSKSVSAYLQVLALQSARIPLTVVTRLRTYSNMLILRVSPREDNKTITGARFRIEFEQLFVANTQANPISARPNDTENTGLGAISTQPPPAAVDTQFGVHAFSPGPSEATAATPFPPDLNNGSLPTVLNGVPGYTDPATGAFTPQFANSVTAVNVPGAGAFSSTNTNSLQQVAGLH